VEEPGSVHKSQIREGVNLVEMGQPDGSRLESRCTWLLEGRDGWCLVDHNGYRQRPRITDELTSLNRGYVFVY
jgi:hypothetical protein